MDVALIENFLVFLPRDSIRDEVQTLSISLLPDKALATPLNMRIQFLKVFDLFIFINQTS
jgi:hypothetical protein